MKICHNRIKNEANQTNAAPKLIIIL